MIPEQRLTKTLEIPEGVTVELNESLKVKGPNGEVNKNLNHPTVEIVVEENKVIVKPKKLTKKEKSLINTYVAHIKNMFKGVTEGFTYKLKVCSGHFPMSVSVEGDKLVVKNFLGEKVPRTAKLLPNVKVEVNGDDVVVTGADKEAVGQTAANIEQSTRITNRCKTRFQDGIWITEKAGKVM
ncbi:50S ribosomal protein L6 [Candidatus Woesearchaeota archaeon]|nr:MAG: 50S ribosomal protein L6 [Candidatus Woesearchaeota archaeon]